jgi:hypothetical protein
MTSLDELVDRSIAALEKKDALELRTVSADALSEAAVEGRSELILTALVDYALSKILSKIRYQEVDEKFYGRIITLFKEAKGSAALEKLEAIEDIVIKLDAKEGDFQANVMDKARLKKAANLYEKGLSLRRASELTGADPAQVLEYIGGSKVHEEELKGKGRNADKLKIAREVFSE